MAQCNFSIPFQSSAEDVAAQARTAILNAGGNFEGDSNAGMFDVSTPLGAIRGNYTIDQAVIHVSITSKPFIVSCGLIESQLRSYFQTVAS
jgi:hypothetical protein